VRLSGTTSLDSDPEIAESWQPGSPVPDLSVVMPYLSESHTLGTRWLFLYPGAILSLLETAIALHVRRLSEVAT